MDCASPARSPAPSGRRVCCCARWSYAACIITMAGTRRRWSPTLSSPTVPQPSSAFPLKRAPAEAWRVVASGSCLIPDSTEAMTWTIGEHGFEMTLSKQVPGLIARHLRPWLESWLAEQGTALAEVQSWAIHPGGPRILSAVEESLNLSREAAAPSRAVFAEHGNMSSPTILFILDRLRRQNAKRPCVALGFGPGLMAEAALLL